MGKEQIDYILKGLVLVAGLAAYFIKAESQRKVAAIALVIMCTVLAVWTFAPLSNRDKEGKGQAVMDSSLSEFIMKLASGLDDLSRDAGAVGMGATKPEDKWQQIIREMHEQAAKSARTAVKADPASVPMRFRQLVIAGESRQPIQEELHELEQLKDDDAAPASRLIEGLYVAHSLPKAETAANIKLVEKLVTRGWLRDVASIEVYRNAGEKHQAEKLLDAYHGALMNYILMLGALAFSAVCLGFLGTIILFFQFFFWPRKLTPDEERNLIAAPAQYGFLKVYGVFAGWLALECVISPLLGELINPLKKLGGGLNPLTTGIIIFIIYTLNNGPSLLIAWLVAIKPAGLHFWESVKLRFRSGNLGPIKLVLCGISAWLCAIPLILVSALVSKSMNSHGSASPILPIISEVVRSGGFFNIFLFVFVLGVMPALCEETLFRGFLYTSLRGRFGVFLSVLISATAFAAVHMDPGAFLQLFVLGVVFALVMERTKSLLPSMIAHCLWNSGTLVLMMVAFGS